MVVQIAKRRVEKEIDSLASPSTRIRGIKDAVAALNANKKALCLIEDDYRCVLGILKRCSDGRWRMSEFRELVKEQTGDLPDSAGFVAEMLWVAAHDQDETPDFSTAPSIIAANLWCKVRTNKDVDRDFWRHLLRIRNPQTANKQSPFKVDQVDVAKQADDQSDAEMMKTLFGSN